MNNKGFSTTILVYTIFSFFIITILLFVKIVTASITSPIYSSKSIKEHINKIVPYDVCLNRVNCK